MKKDDHMWNQLITKIRKVTLPMLINIALLTDIAVHNLTRRISLEIDQKFDMGLDSCRFPPHITLKQAFSFNGDINKLATVFDAFCHISAPIIVRYSGIEAVTSPQNRTTIWLNVVRDRKLENMQELLLQLLADQCDISAGLLDGKNWRFHTTLAQGEIDLKDIYAIKELASRHVNQLNSPISHAIMLITPPHKEESLEHSVSYRIKKLTGPI
ncbi:MAG TPA: 2'-5' RNA ligase family protein [Clostridiaceae bacterium]|nr:2'-5' RNA ligase family protein [Clostridiaceae bacterium]